MEECVCVELVDEIVDVDCKVDVMKNKVMGVMWVFGVCFGVV